MGAICWFPLPGGYGVDYGVEERWWPVSSPMYVSVAE